MSIQICREPADAVALYLPQGLFLKSFAKLNISVQLPTHKVQGKSISNWELMEKIRKMIQPDSFSLLKVTKSSSEVIRFDAELECREKLGRVLARLNDRVIQLCDYPEPLRVRVMEAKSDFPSRHSWDSFFRDAKDMDEMKPGERPDTIHMSNLPISWFINSKDRHDDPLPSESICKKVFEKYGDIRQVDVPTSDPYRMQMKEAMRGITVPTQDSALFFEAYVQFSEYVGFVRCMDALRGSKLLRKKEDLAEWCTIHVDFDKTKHMTDAAVKRRAIVRERLASRQRAKELEEKEERERISNREARERLKSERAEREKLERMREREERRKKKQLAKLMERDDVDLGKQVAEEQHKLLKVQKKLQAIRLIEELFKRIELRPESGAAGGARAGGTRGERAARARVVDRMKQQQERLLDRQRDQLRHAMNGRIVIRSALETKKGKRSSSMSSLSSDEDAGLKKLKLEKVTSPDPRDMEMKTGPGMYGVPNPYAFGVPGAYHPFAPHPGYGFPQTSMYYGVRGAYCPAEGYARRARGRARGRGGRGVRLPFFDGPDATNKYYRYFKQLTQTEHDDRSRSRSRSRSRRRSYSRSRSRSRRRSYTRSRSRRRSRSRSRRERSHSRRRDRSRGRRSRSHHSRSRSRSRRSRSKTRSKSKSRTPNPSPKELPQTAPEAPHRSWSETPEDK